jgi:DNA polymerase I-like protein with 3'-5' exonuclease and polymerase domains
MLLQCDAKGLEWVCASFLSQDKVAAEEIRNEIDQHHENQTMLKLPTRLIAKTFVFRLIYGGSAYSYAHDANFTECGLNEKKWQGVIDGFYEKYSGLKQWHIAIMQEVQATGRLVLPTGRIYTYEPNPKTGDWPRTTILNYPVQGLGADIMALARVSFFNKLKKLGLKDYLLTNTVHDSILIDTKEENTEVLYNLLTQTFKDLPANFQKLFGVEFNLPLVCTIDRGINWKEMELI